MTENQRDNLSEVERQSAISRAWNSIRTQFSLMTAAFLLAALAVFYIGGRIVLVHLVRDTERQVQEIGLDISRIAYKNADRVKKAALQVLGDENGTVELKPLVINGTFYLAAGFSADGKLQSGFCRLKDGAVASLTEDDFKPYDEHLRRWAAETLRQQASSAATGILRIHDLDCYVVMMRRGGDCLLFGLPFSSSSFLSEVNDNLGGMEIRVTNRKIGVSLRPQAASQVSRATGTDSGFGIAPIFSEALNFYSGGFWNLSDNPFEAVYAVRDIAGNAISMVAVSIPQTFSDVTRSAIGRLSFFVAMGGILFVLPLFWLQGKVLLNPLSKMTEAVARIGQHNADTDCPRLEWKGKDEFALLAVSVNRMLETISARAISVAQTEARHQALIDCLPDALAIFDPLGRLVAITKEAEDTQSIPGISPGEIPDAAVYGRESVLNFLAQLEQTFRTGRIGKARLKVQRPLGAPRSTTTRHFELRITRMDEYFALVIWRDTTEEVAEHKLRLAAEARQNDMRKRESLTLLAASIAHDMNNVLSVVLNAAEADCADPSGDSADALRTIRAAVLRGTGMMRELREFAGENRMSFLRMRVAVILEDVRVLTEGMLLRNILFSYKADADAPDVDADPNQFWKVIFNIVKNAGEAIGKNRPGRIDICCRKMEMTAEEATKFISEKPLSPGVGTVITVQDDGPGIPESFQSKLFDPYVSSKSVGRGLGLATVRTIVEAHGGGLRVTSQEGKGTLFEIYLPASQQEVPEGADRPEAEASRKGNEVLVVDDDVSILRTVSILLKTMKFVPHVAKDQMEAMAVIRRNASNLRAVILDADLGGTDSVRLLGAFRESAPHVPIIVSSGSAEDDIRHLFAPHPYDAFLPKPYTIMELKTALS